MLFHKTKTVSGTVTGESGIPIPGVNILIKGTTTGNITDFDGKYTINNISLNNTLVFTYIGFAKQEIVFTGQKILNITLLEDTSTLDEVVVIGYGTSKRKDLTGAISSVSASELEISHLHL